MAEFKNMETERLILRRFIEEDADEFLNYRTSQEVRMYQGEGWENFKMEQCVEFIKEQMNFEPGIPDSWFQIAIELKKSGELIGDCAIHTLPVEKGLLEIGITIKPAFQHRGYAAEAVKCLLNYLFNGLKIAKVIAIIDTRNENCRRLLEGLGMTNTEYDVSDESMYELLKENWGVR